MEIAELLSDLRGIAFSEPKNIGKSSEIQKSISIKINKKLSQEGVDGLKFDIVNEFHHPIEFTNIPTVLFNKNDKFDFVIQGYMLDSENIPVMGDLERMVACSTCSGYRGTCSIFAPYINLISKNKKLFLLTITLDYWYIIRAVTLNFTRKMTIITGILMADKLSESVARTYLSYFHSKFSGMKLTLGNCPAGCKPCTVIDKKPCSNPKARTFSLEATGINCEQLHRNNYKSILPWFYKGTGILPQYISRYCGILIDKDISFSDIWGEVKLSNIPEFSRIGELSKQDNLIDIVQIVPVGYNTGSIQRGYKV